MRASRIQAPYVVLVLNLRVMYVVHQVRHDILQLTNEIWVMVHLEPAEVY